jgi:DNA-directed RNA polymerase subunit beta
VQGIVINAKVFARKGTEKDDRAKDIEDAETERLLTDQRDEVKIISESYASPAAVVANVKKALGR